MVKDIITGANAFMTLMGDGEKDNLVGNTHIRRRTLALQSCIYGVSSLDSIAN